MDSLALHSILVFLPNLRKQRNHLDGVIKSVPDLYFLLMSTLDENNCKTSEEVQGLMTDGWCRMGGSLPPDLIIGSLLLSKLSSYFDFAHRSWWLNTSEVNTSSLNRFCQSSSSEDLRLPGVTTFCLTHSHLMEDLLFQGKKIELFQVCFLSLDYTCLASLCSGCLSTVDSLQGFGFAIVTLSNVFS